jgi:hypothetical protein
MSRSRYLVLPLALGLLAGAACSWDLTGFQEICLHSEGCGGGGGWDFHLPLVFTGVVTSATTGKSVAEVTVRIEAPARAWSETVLTDSTGRYVTTGLPGPVAGDCAGLSVNFSRDGYQSLRIVSFPQLTCSPGAMAVDASLTPTP